MSFIARKSRSRSVSSTSELQEEPYTLDVLPPELLSYIFTFAWPKRRFAHQVPFEVQLSHVCRKWREIALSTPVLWTKISIYAPDSLKWVPTYLLRSGTHLPLSLIIDVYRWDKRRRFSDAVTRATFATSIFSHLAPHYARLDHLSIVCYYEFTAINIQTPLTSTSAPNLEAINIQFDRPFVTPGLQLQPPKIFTGGTPNLSFIDTPFINYFSKANLRKLTTLFLSIGESVPLSYTELVELLTAPTALRHLSLSGWSNHLLSLWPFHRVNADPDLRLSNLKSLRLIDSSMLVVKFLLSVSAPQLESIWINTSLDNFHNFFDSQQINVPITGGGLSKFRAVKYLTIAEYNLGYVIKFSEAFPNVTHFAVPHLSFFNVEFLVSAMANWKDMESLIFTQARQSHWEKFAIAMEAMLEERSLTRHPIKSFIMDRDFRKMLEERIPHLSDLVEVLDLSPETYKEPWYTKSIGNPFADEL
ncbi:hypothetical protein BDN70DRAFT_916544 [Pholiota conissans]|uniref:F-box domain-containing protein n=1 Tax=Pholiota conissans TaxID=109636 RepID=A0A9P6CZ63_9AGAR|nr:hypothetical protein BDN70DRAFT_916544 [Pholiota conissans]